MGGGSACCWMEERCTRLYDVPVMASCLCSMAPGSFGEIGVSGTSSTHKLVRGSRGEVGKGLKCAPRGGQGCASHHGIQGDRGPGCNSCWGSQKVRERLTAVLAGRPLPWASVSCGPEVAVVGEGSSLGSPWLYA